MWFTPLFISIISIFRPVVFSLDLAACLAGTLSCFSLTILVPYQNGGLKTTGSWVKIPQILKLNHSHSKHWNQVLNHLNGSLWTKSSGILVFLFMSSIYCIARTLLPLAYRKKINETKVWASTEAKPSNKIEIHKAKKYYYSKFDFILISDCLADIHGT